MGDIADRIIDALSMDIGDRRGLKWEWQRIDDNVMHDELRPAWRKIISAEIKPLEAVLAAAREHDKDLEVFIPAFPKTPKLASLGQRALALREAIRAVDELAKGKEGAE